MNPLPDHFFTINLPATGEFKDRGSKFLAFAYPVKTENQCLELIESLRKLHFKSNHHCFAWRLGTDGQRFRASDDGEPSGTAGRPILAQIDRQNLTDILVVVARYFGGTLLGASGLINAYRESAAAALENVEVVERIIAEVFLLDFGYEIMPEVMNVLKKLDIRLVAEKYGERAVFEIGIRKSLAAEFLLKFKANVLKISTEEAEIREWPEGFLIEKMGEMEV